MGAGGRCGVSYNRRDRSSAQAPRAMPHRPSVPARRGRTPNQPETGTTTAHVQSLTRGLTILERLGEVEGGLTLTDIAQRVGLAASTTHRLLNTLEKMDYVHQSGDLGL